MNPILVEDAFRLLKETIGHSCEPASTLNRLCNHACNITAGSCLDDCTKLVNAGTLTTDGELSGVVLVVEPSRPAEILPLVVASYGLTRREREVLGEMSNGQSTAEIAGQLFISEHTVRDHIKSILAKTGTSSRGELMSLLFQHRV